MFEKAWYEISPVIYLIVSCVIIVNTNHTAAFFASLLLIMSLLIGFMRFQFRTNPTIKRKRERQLKGNQSRRY